MARKSQPMDKAQTMDKSQVSAMLGYLKYRADPSKNKSMANFEASSQALRVYATMPADKKKAFLARFMADTKRELDWVNHFEEKNEQILSKEESVIEGLFNRNEILELNGFRAGDMSPQDADALCVHLIKESEDEWDYKSSTKKGAVFLTDKSNRRPPAEEAPSLIIKEPGGIERELKREGGEEREITRERGKTIYTLVAGTDP